MFLPFDPQSGKNFSLKLETNLSECSRIHYFTMPVHLTCRMNPQNRVHYATF